MPLFITDSDLNQLQAGIDSACQELNTLKTQVPELFEALGFDASDAINAAALIAALRHRLKTSPTALANYLVVLPLTHDQANWLKDQLSQMEHVPHARLIEVHLIEALASAQKPQKNGERT